MTIATEPTRSLFRPAQRHQKKLRCAVEGTSGSGKTMSAIKIAKGLTSGDLSKVAVIDTEHESADLYAELGPYFVLPFGAPFSPKRYMAAMQAAVDEGFDVVIIDSLSHAWMGPGGVLEKVDEYAKRNKSGNKFAAWDEGTRMQNELIEYMLGLPIHVIATMRSKTVWGEEIDERSGKKKPVKIGVGAQQRKEMDFEFDLVLQLDSEHTAAATKHRTQALWDDRFEVLSEKHGEELLAWLNQGAPAPFHTAPPMLPVDRLTDPDDEPIGPDAFEAMVAALAALDISEASVRSALAAIGYGSAEEAPRGVAKDIFHELKAGAATPPATAETQPLAEPAAEPPAPAPQAAAASPAPATITAAETERLRAVLYAKGRDQAKFSAWLLERFNVGDGETLQSIPSETYRELLEMVAKLPDPPPPEPRGPQAVEPVAEAAAPESPSEAQAEASEPERHEVAAAATKTQPKAKAEAEETGKRFSLTDAIAADAAKLGPQQIYPYGCSLAQGIHFQRCAAMDEGVAADALPCAECSHMESQAIVKLDEENRADAKRPSAERPIGNQPVPEEAPYKKGSITGPQLTRISAQVNELESLGVGRAEWRIWMADKFGVAHRDQLTKTTTATQCIDALQRWIVDIKSGVVAPGQRVA